MKKKKKKKQTFFYVCATCDLATLATLATLSIRATVRSPEQRSNKKSDAQISSSDSSLYLI